MPTLLAADVGGTKTILRLAEFLPPIKLQSKSPPIHMLYEQTYVSQDFPDLVPMVKIFFAEAQKHLGHLPSPRVACFGIAGPVVDNRSELTNLKWSLDAKVLEKKLDIPQVVLINDFAANGYGVLGLAESDLHTLQSTPAQGHAPIAIIGAGTGLGEAFLIPQSGCYHVFPGEGGHTDFAPQTDIAYQLCRYLQKRENISHVSIERIVSGIGLVSIYECFRDDYERFRQTYGFEAEAPNLTAAFEAWDQAKKTGETVESPAALIAKHAMEEDDRLSQKTMQLFVQLYGAEAGNFALKLLPYGGLYITGGIAAKILPLIEKEGFLEAFLNKGRVSSLLKNIPVHIVLNPKVGLIGAVLYAAKLGSTAAV
ncbi:MAG: glucokinase [Cyanobacteria bacterium P01_F01_bin.53]